jgi:hypothetical protein
MHNENEYLYEIGSCSLKISSFMNEYHKHNVKEFYETFPLNT